MKRRLKAIRPTLMTSDAGSDQIDKILQKPDEEHEEQLSHLQVYQLFHLLTFTIFHPEVSPPEMASHLWLLEAFHPASPSYYTR